MTDFSDDDINSFLGSKTPDAAQSTAPSHNYSNPQPVQEEDLNAFLSALPAPKQSKQTADTKKEPENDETSSVGGAKAFAMGAGQGLTMGFLPRMAAAIKAAGSSSANYYGNMDSDGQSNIDTPSDFSHDYNETKSDIDNYSDKMQKEHPWAYTGGDAAGTLALTAVPVLGEYSGVTKAKEAAAALEKLVPAGMSAAEKQAIMVQQNYKDAANAALKSSLMQTTKEGAALGAGNMLSENPDLTDLKTDTYNTAAGAVLGGASTLGIRAVPNAAGFVSGLPWRAAKWIGQKAHLTDNNNAGTVAQVLGGIGESGIAHVMGAMPLGMSGLAAGSGLLYKGARRAIGDVTGLGAPAVDEATANSLLGKLNDAQNGRQPNKN